MTNTIAIPLAGLILAGVVIDMTLDLGIIVFLFRKLGELIEWMAFWR
jgi:hypothetical protein